MKKVLVMAAVAALAGCRRQEPVAAAAEQQTPIVAAARSARMDLSRELTLTGELVPFQEVEVMSKVAGFVQRIYVDVGDAVRQGQVIAILEIPEMKDDITRASASIARSRAEVERAMTEVVRTERAHQIAHLAHDRLSSVFRSKPGLVAQQEVDDAHARDQISESQVAAAKSALASAREQIKVGEADRGKAETLLQYSRVTAPFDGVITKRYANNGSMIQAGVASQSQAMPLVRLSQNSRLRLILDVPESAVGAVRTGSAVAIRIPSLNRELQGRVSRSSGRVSTSTRTMHTEVDIDNSSRKLIPGVSAEVALRIADRPRTLAVPLDAVAREGESHAVWVVTGDQRVEKRAVRTGIESSTMVEIVEGLADGELVVLGGAARIKPNQKVKTTIGEAAGRKAGD